MTTDGPTGEPADEQGESEPPQDIELSILGVQPREGGSADEVIVDLHTSRGLIETHLHPCEGKTGCVIFVGGGMGGVQGPANSVYERLSRDLVAKGVTSLRVQWRQPSKFEECVADALAACSFLRGIGAERAVLVGHSFGGAVAIKAAELGDLVNAVAGLSSQRWGTHGVQNLGKPLLLLHGGDDTVLLAAASDDIYQRAEEPKRMVILEGATHGLAESADEVYDLLSEFIVEHAGDEAAPP